MSISIRFDDLFEKELPGLHWGVIRDEKDLFRRAARMGRKNKVTRCLNIAWWLLKAPEEEICAYTFASGLWKKGSDEYIDATNFFRSKTSDFQEKEGPPYYLTPLEIAGKVSEHAIIVGYLFLCLSDNDMENNDKVFSVLDKLKISRTPPQPHHGFILNIPSANPNLNLEVEQVKGKPKPEQVTALIEIGNHPKSKKSLAMKWPRRLVSAIVLAFLISGTAFFVNSIDPKLIIEIAEKDGAKEAIAFAKASVFRQSEVENYVYNLGYAFYRAQENENARLHAHNLLSLQKTTSRGRGKAFYLLGLTFAKNDPENAMLFFKQAKSEFLASKQWHRLYLATIERIKACILLGKLDQAASELEEALIYFENSKVANKNLARWYSAKLRLERALGNCDELVRYANSGYLEVVGKGNLDLETNFLIHISLAHILRGNIQIGEFFANAAQKNLDYLHDERNSIFNKCNYALILKLKNEDSSGLIQDIEEWAEMHEDSDLRWHLKTIFSQDCYTL